MATKGEIPPELDRLYNTLSGLQKMGIGNKDRIRQTPASRAVSKLLQGTPGIPEYEKSLKAAERLIRMNKRRQTT